MTLIINQSDLHRFERLVSKLAKPSELPATVCFIPHGDNLTLAVFCKDATLTMLMSNQCDAPFAIQWADFKAIAVKKDVIVTFDLNKDTVHCQYENEQQWFKVDKKVATLPSKPDATVTYDKNQLLDALVTASKCTDPDNVRYAIGGICFRGEKRQIISTSGTQALVQENFEFPWNDKDILCPVSKIFASKELRAIDTDELLLGQIKEPCRFRLSELFLLNFLTGS